MYVASLFCCLRYLVGLWKKQLSINDISLPQVCDIIYGWPDRDELIIVIKDSFYCSVYYITANFKRSTDINPALWTCPSHEFPYRITNKKSKLGIKLFINLFKDLCRCKNNEFWLLTDERIASKFVVLSHLI